MSSEEYTNENNDMQKTMEESLREKHVVPPGFVGLLFLIIVFFAAWYGYQYFSGNMAAREKTQPISEEKMRELIEQTTAPSEVQLPEKEKQVLIEETTAPSGNTLSEEEKQKLIDSTTAPR